MTTIGRRQEDPAPAAPDVPEQAGLPPAAGQATVVLAGLSIGLVLVGIQLWLLTVALDLYLAGQGRRVWGVAVSSGAIFLGGVLLLRLLGRRRRVRRRW